MFAIEVTGNSKKLDAFVVLNGHPIAHVVIEGGAVADGWRELARLILEAPEVGGDVTGDYIDAVVNHLGE